MYHYPNNNERFVFLARDQLGNSEREEPTKTLYNSGQIDKLLVNRYRIEKHEISDRVNSV